MITLTCSEAVDAIRRRVSVRTFDDVTPGTAVLRDAGAADSPYLRIIDPAAIGRGRVGTYGFISGTAAYVAVVCSPDRLLDAGIDGERMVLRLTAAGLGTCWLGGTFNRSQIRAALPGLDTDQKIVAIIAVGHPLQRRRLVERMLRTVARSDSRKPLDRLVIAGTVPAALAETMECVRLAPSAANRQPWRFAFNADGTIDVFGDPADSFMTLDIGIAIAHFTAVTPARLTPNPHTHPSLRPIITLSPEKAE